MKKLYVQDFERGRTVPDRNPLDEPEIGIMIHVPIPSRSAGTERIGDSIKSMRSCAQGLTAAAAKDSPYMLMTSIQTESASQRSFR